MTKSETPRGDKSILAKHHPFRRAVLRGLAIVMPPLLTLVVFLWMGNIINDYVLAPLEARAVGIIVRVRGDVKDEIPEGVVPRRDEAGRPVSFSVGDTTYVPFRERWIPLKVKKTVDAYDREHTYAPTTARNYAREFVRIEHLPRWKTIPVFLAIFVLILYLIGKLVAARAGKLLWSVFERLIQQLPIIRTVYSAAQQVTDFVFKEQEVEFTRVVAVQYPREGIWSMGFVTGESLVAIRRRVGEPVLTVLMPTSPMPATGFTITVPRSQTIDLDITVDQAIQFCVSCGVVVPLHQQYDNEEVARRFQAALASTGERAHPVLPAPTEDAGGTPDQPQQA